MLANRLTEDPEVCVLLLEAGGKDDYHWIHVPVGYLYCIGNPRTDWLYKTQRRTRPERPLPVIPARQSAGRQLVHQRHDLHARPARRLRRMGPRHQRRLLVLELRSSPSSNAAKTTTAAPTNRMAQAAHGASKNNA